MLFNSKNPTALYNEIKGNLERLGISNFSESSIAHILITTVVENYRSNVQAIEETLRTLDFSSAEGKDLELFANLFGVTIEPKKRAFTKEGERNTCFYVSSGTFGDLNSGAAIIIPASTIIYYENRSKSAKTEYRLKSAVTLQPGDSIAYFAAEALEFGTAGNIGKLLVTNHTVLQYPTLLVKNNYPIVNGIEAQSDDTTRFLISQKIRNVNGSGTSAIRYLMSRTAGVKEYKIINFYEGIGNTGVIVDFTDNEVSDSYIKAIENSLYREAVSAGESLTVERVSQIKLSFDLEITSTASSSLLEETIKGILSEAVSQLTIGDSLNLQNLLDSIMEIDGVDAITNDTFTNTYIRYIASDLSESTTTTTDLTITPEENQKIFLEEDFLNLTVI